LHHHHLKGGRSVLVSVNLFSVVAFRNYMLLLLMQVAGRSLGELVRKLGERVLPLIIPILSQGLSDPDSSRRQVRIVFWCWDFYFLLMNKVLHCFLLKFSSSTCYLIQLWILLFVRVYVLVWVKWWQVLVRVSCWLSWTNSSQLFGLHSVIGLCILILISLFAEFRLRYLILMDMLTVCLRFVNQLA